MNELSIKLIEDSTINYTENKKNMAFQIRLDTIKDNIKIDNESNYTITGVLQHQDEDIAKKSSLTQQAKKIFISSTLYKDKYKNIR